MLQSILFQLKLQQQNTNQSEEIEIRFVCVCADVEIKQSVKDVIVLHRKLFTSTFVFGVSQFPGVL